MMPFAHKSRLAACTCFTALTSPLVSRCGSSPRVLRPTLPASLAAVRRCTMWPLLKRRPMRWRRLCSGMSSRGSGERGCSHRLSTSQTALLSASPNQRRMCCCSTCGTCGSLSVCRLSSASAKRMPISSLLPTTSPPMLLRRRICSTRWLWRRPSAPHRRRLLFEFSSLLLSTTRFSCGAAPQLRQHSSEFWAMFFQNCPAPSARPIRIGCSTLFSA